jgi:hypothetical protein
VKNGEQVVGNKTRVKVVKNKVAPMRALRMGFGVRARNAWCDDKNQFVLDP